LPRRRITSQNRMFRCAASTRYSIAGAVNPNSGAAPFVDDFGRLGDTGIAVDPSGSPRASGKQNGQEMTLLKSPKYFWP